MMGLGRRIDPWLALAMLALPLIPACGDGKPSVDRSTTEAKVSGIVKVRGKPAEGGTILFNPSNSERTVATNSAPIGKDGSYSITTYTGGNQVSFDGEIAAKNPGVGLAKEYLEVQPGDNKHDFDLMGEGSGKQMPFQMPPGAMPKR
jgi:hypothetical protein